MSRKGDDNIILKKKTLFKIYKKIKKNKWIYFTVLIIWETAIREKCFYF